MKRHVIRTVNEDGSVLINGVRFFPDQRHVKYDGRLDGQRLVFGLYYTEGKWDSTMVSLSCTEQMWKVPRPKDDDEDFARWERELEACPRPDVVDGAHVWMFWHAAKGNIVKLYREEKRRDLKWYYAVAVKRGYNDDTYMREMHPTYSDF